MRGSHEADDDSFVCPHCGADVPAGAEFCRACGASDESGWIEDDAAWEGESPSGYAPDDEFDYDDFVRREFPDRASPLSAVSLKRWATAAIVVLICLALLLWTVL
jgi:hypothetical protein